MKHSYITIKNTKSNDEDSENYDEDYSPLESRGRGTANKKARE